MKTIAAFTNPMEAHLLIARLRGSGIGAFARDEHLVTLDWFYSNAIGGVKVEVGDDDLDRAREIMNATGPEERGPRSEAAGGSSS